MDKEELKAIRRRLESELSTVEHQLDEHGAFSQGEGGIDVGVDEGFADSAQATAERSAILSFIGHLESTSSQIREALARIDSGTYGECTSCGRDIAVERLEALPTTTQCITCKQSGASSSAP